MFLPRRWAPDIVIISGYVCSPDPHQGLGDCQCGRCRLLQRHRCGARIVQCWWLQVCLQLTEVWPTKDLGILLWIPTDNQDQNKIIKANLESRHPWSDVEKYSRVYVYLKCKNVDMFVGNWWSWNSFIVVRWWDGDATYLVSCQLLLLQLQ